MAVAVTVTWSLGPGEDGEMPDVLMFGPGGGAATIATDGSSSRSEDKGHVSCEWRQILSRGIIMKAETHLLVTVRH